MATDPGLTFVATKSTLLSILKPIVSIIPSSSSLPALLNFHVTVSDAGIRVVGTDYTTVVARVSTEVEVYGSGVVLIPAKKFYSIVQQIPQDATLETSLAGDKILVFASDGSQWTLTPFESSSFPKISLKSKTASVSRQDLISSLEFVKVAASKDPSNPVLSVMDCSGEKLTAFDSSRLQQITLNQSLPFQGSIANNSLSSFIKVLHEMTRDLISVGANDKYIVATDAELTVAVAVPSVSFPKVEQLVIRPAIENSYDLVVDRQELINALKKVKITTDVESKAAEIEIDKSQLVVASRDRFGSSSAKAKIECQWGYEPRTLLINCEHLIQILDSHTEERLTLKLGKDLKTRKTPILIKTSRKVSVLQQMMAEWVN